MSVEGENPSSGMVSRETIPLLAERTASMTASEIRALFAVASRPEIVSLAGGMPYVSALPLAEIGNKIAELIKTRGTYALQYGSAQGDPQLREEIVSVMAVEGIAAHPDDVVVTTGSQQALDLLTRVFINPGDVILAEAPSYVGALQAFRSYEAEVVHVDMDEQGLHPEALSSAIAGCQAQGKAPKFVYTIPTFHNPAGVTQTLERRQRIVSLCAQSKVPLVEDNPYGLLGFDHQTLPALRSINEDVIYLGSFSKTFAPGTRVGWVVAPRVIRDKLILAAEATMLCPSALAQTVVCTYLQEFDWQQQITSYRNIYRERRDAVIETLTAAMPEGVHWTVPQGGFYVWVNLPMGIDSALMLPRALNARVAYVPGSAFYSGAGRVLGESSLRLSYCFPPVDQLREGVRRLAGVVNEELELRHILGPTQSKPQWRQSDNPNVSMP